MALEIERKFLVLPGVQVPAADLPEGAGALIMQGYLAVGADGSEARLRRHGERCSLTAKRGSGLVRQEWETDLGAEQFDRLWPGTAGARLVKTRHPVPVSGGLALLDVYQGAHQGLRVVEVEFPDVTEAEAFQPPSWFGPEITGLRGYANQHLAVATPEEIADLLRP